MNIGRYAVVDVETTGLDPIEHRVVECAVVELDREGSPVDEWTSLIRVPRSHPVNAQWIHGIDSQMLSSAPRFDQILGALVDRLRGRTLVGHVIAFDLAHLQAEFRRTGLNFPDLTSASICTRDLARRSLPPGPRSLAACCASLDIVFPYAHTALGDARATAKLFSYFVANGTFELADSPDLAIWPKYLDRTVLASPRKVATELVPIETTRENQYAYS